MTTIHVTQLPQTHKKLREARFFLRHLQEKAEAVAVHDSEEFDFYLSAFLNANWSVGKVLRTEFLQTDQTARDSPQRRKWFTDWFSNWKKGLTTTQQDLWKFADDQRGIEVHQKGANVRAETEFIPLTHLPREDRSHPAYGFHWFGPPTMPPPKIGLRVHYFERNDSAEKAIDTCRRYFELARKLVQDFEQASPP